jgi:hypothetical protein
MKKTATGALLVVALVLPVVLFLLLPTRFHLSQLAAAIVAVVSGWALNIAWASMAQMSTGKDQSNDNFLSIATRFGWACPALLVLITWAVWRFS